MPGLTDQARNLTLTFYNQYALSTIMLFDIMTKNPLMMQRVMTLPTFKQMAIYTGPKGVRSMTASDLNEKASDIAEVGKAHYELMEKMAKENGVRVPTEISKRG